MSLKDEVPNTHQGLMTYIEYCKTQIERDRKNISRIERNLKIAMNRLELFTNE